MNPKSIITYTNLGVVPEQFERFALAVLLVAPAVRVRTLLPEQEHVGRTAVEKDFEGLGLRWAADGNGTEVRNHHCVVI